MYDGQGSLNYQAFNGVASVVLMVTANKLEDLQPFVSKFNGDLIYSERGQGSYT